MSMILQCKESSRPHPEGIHPAVCLDVIDLGLVEVEFQGQRQMKNKLKLVFETEAKGEDGKNCTVSKNFTASLHPKAKLSEFLGKWRGRPVMPGETINLDKVIGASCTLVISHQKNLVGRTYAAIDAVSKPSKKVTPSGQYDGADMRRRIAEANARRAQNPKAEIRNPKEGRVPNSEFVNGRANEFERWGSDPGLAGAAVQSAVRPVAPTESAMAPLPKSDAAPAAASPAYDPEVGF
jgi:hypothetical protein